MIPCVYAGLSVQLTSRPEGAATDYLPNKQGPSRWTKSTKSENCRPTERRVVDSVLQYFVTPALIAGVRVYL